MRGWHFKEIPDEDIVRGEHLKKKSRLKILPLTRVRGFLFVKSGYSRLKKHFKTYRLGQAYAIQASTEIAENIILWKHKYKKLGKEVFVIFLKECLQSKECYMKNIWNTAFLRALINNIDVLG